VSSEAVRAETAVPIERLLKAWRGEIEAEAVYSVLAARETDRKRTSVLERMAAAEVNHRRRIEHRLRELGIAARDPAKARISPWLRLQAWLAPRDRLLARMEANEQEEINDRSADDSKSKEVRPQ
jgi:rubrerythrin